MLMQNLHTAIDKDNKGHVAYQDIERLCYEMGERFKPYTPNKRKKTLNPEP